MSAMEIAGHNAPAGVSEEGLRSYYTSKIEELEVLIRDKSANLERLKAQRNELNAKGSHLGPACRALYARAVLAFGSL